MNGGLSFRLATRCCCEDGALDMESSQGDVVAVLLFELVRKGRWRARVWMRLKLTETTVGPSSSVYLL